MTDQTPNPVDLTFLADRARAYVIGLEARLRERNEQVEALRLKLADPSQRDEKAIRSAYRRGWEDACGSYANAAQDAAHALAAARNAAVARYTEGPQAKENPND